MSIVGLLRRQWSAAREALWKARARRTRCSEVRRSDWPASLIEPTAFYRWCFDCFDSHLPPSYREHRAYFHNVPSNRRGFGEDAFHVLWYLLLEEFRPANFLEIGVFRGQVISLVALWAKLGRQPCDVHGISPFSAVGDSVSTYRGDIDYYRDTLANFDWFSLEYPHLLRAYSTEPVARERIHSKTWDMIYIDGNHDYEVVRIDWETCAAAVKPSGVIVLDDAGLTTAYRPPAFAWKGHPGPSRLATEIDRNQFAEVLQVGHNRVFQKIAR